MIQRILEDPRWQDASTEDRQRVADNIAYSLSSLAETQELDAEYKEKLNTVIDRLQQEADPDFFSIENLQRSGKELAYSIASLVPAAVNSFGSAVRNLPNVPEYLSRDDPSESVRALAGSAGGAAASLGTMAQSAELQVKKYGTFDGAVISEELDRFRQKLVSGDHPRIRDASGEYTHEFRKWLQVESAPIRARAASLTGAHPYSDINTPYSDLVDSPVDPPDALQEDADPDLLRSLPNNRKLLDVAAFVAGTRNPKHFNPIAAALTLPDEALQLTELKEAFAPEEGKGVVGQIWQRARGLAQSPTDLLTMGAGMSFAAGRALAPKGIIAGSVAGATTEAAQEAAAVLLENPYADASEAAEIGAGMGALGGGFGAITGKISLAREAARERKADLAEVQQFEAQRQREEDQTALDKIIADGGIDSEITYTGFETVEQPDGTKKKVPKERTFRGKQITIAGKLQTGIGSRQSANRAKSILENLGESDLKVFKSKDDGKYYIYKDTSTASKTANTDFSRLNDQVKSFEFETTEEAKRVADVINKDKDFVDGYTLRKDKNGKYRIALKYKGQIQTTPQSEFAQRSKDMYDAVTSSVSGKLYKTREAAENAITYQRGRAGDVYALTDSKGDPKTLNADRYINMTVKEVDGGFAIDVEQLVQDTAPTASRSLLVEKWRLIDEARDRIALEQLQQEEAQAQEARDQEIAFYGGVAREMVDAITQNRDFQLSPDVLDQYFGIAETEDQASKPKTFAQTSSADLEKQGWRRAWHGSARGKIQGQLRTPFFAASGEQGFSNAADYGRQYVNVPIENKQGEIIRWEKRKTDNEIRELYIDTSGALNLNDYTDWVDVVESLEADGVDTSALKQAIVDSEYNQTTWDKYKEAIVRNREETTSGNQWDPDGNNLSFTTVESERGQTRAKDNRKIVDALFNLGYEVLIQPEASADAIIVNNLDRVKEAKDIAPSPAKESVPSERTKAAAETFQEDAAAQEKELAETIVRQETFSGGKIKDFLDNILILDPDFTREAAESADAILKSYEVIKDRIDRLTGVSEESSQLAKELIQLTERERTRRFETLKQEDLAEYNRQQDILRQLGQTPPQDFVGAGVPLSVADMLRQQKEARVEQRAIVESKIKEILGAAYDDVVTDEAQLIEDSIGRMKRNQGRMNRMRAGGFVDIEPMIQAAVQAWKGAKGQFAKFVEILANLIPNATRFAKDLYDTVREGVTDGMVAKLDLGSKYLKLNQDSPAKVNADTPFNQEIERNRRLNALTQNPSGLRAVGVGDTNSDTAAANFSGLRNGQEYYRFLGDEDNYTIVQNAVGLGKVTGAINAAYNKTVGRWLPNQWIRSALRRIDARGIIDQDTPEVRGLVAGLQWKHEIGASAALTNQVLKRDRIELGENFAFNEDGSLSQLKQETATADLHEAFQRDERGTIEKYGLNDRQVDSIRKAIRKSKDILSMLAEEGALPAFFQEVGIENAKGYFPRGTPVDFVEGSESYMNSRKNGPTNEIRHFKLMSIEKARKFDTQLEGIKAGVRYKESAADLLADMYSQALRIIARERFRRKIDTFGTKGKPKFADTRAMQSLEDVAIEGERIFQGYMFDPKTARMVKSIFEDPGNFLKSVNNINQLGKAAIAGYDFSAPFIQLFHVLLTNPIVWGKSVLRSFVSFFSSDYFNEWYTRGTRPQTVAELANLGLQVGVAAEEMSGFISKHGRQPGWFARTGAPFMRAFQNALDAAAVEMWEANKSVDMQMIDAHSLAEWIGSMTGRGKIGEVGISTNQHMVEKILFFSSSYQRSILNLMSMVATGDRRALTAMASMSGVAVTATIAFQTALEAMGIAADEDDDAIFNKLNPASRDFLTFKVKMNDAGEVMTIRLNAGMVGYTSLMRNIYNTFVPMEEGGSKGTKGVLKPSLKDNVLMTFLRGKSSPVPSTAADLITGEDFMGNPNTWGNLALRRLTPIWFQGAVTDDMTLPMVGTEILGIGTYREGKSQAVNRQLNLEAAKRGYQDFSNVPTITEKADIRWSIEKNDPTVTYQELLDASLTGKAKAASEAGKEAYSKAFQAYQQGEIKKLLPSSIVNPIDEHNETFPLHRIEYPSFRRGQKVTVLNGERVVYVLDSDDVKRFRDAIISYSSEYLTPLFESAWWQQATPEDRQIAYSRFMDTVKETTKASLGMQ